MTHDTIEQMQQICDQAEAQDRDLSEAEFLEVKRLDTIFRSNPLTEKETNMSGLQIIKSDKERQYNLNNFLLAIAGHPQAQKSAGFELELSAEAGRLSGKSATDGHFVPWGIIAKAQDSTTAPSGTPPKDNGYSLSLPKVDNSLFTITSAATFKQSIAGRLGVSFHSAPATSELKIPRLVDTVKTNFVARDTALADTSAKFDTISAKPHTAGGLVTINRSALIDTDPSMEGIVMAELRKSLDDLVDNVILSEVVNANAPKSLRQLLTTKGTITSAAALLKLIREMRVIDDTAQWSLLTGYGFDEWASLQPISNTLNQVPLYRDGVIATAKDIGVINTTKLDVTAANAVTDLVDLIIGDFSRAHFVGFGGGVQLASNIFADSVWSKGAMNLRIIMDCDFLVTDISRFALANIEIVAPAEQTAKSK